MTPVEDGDVRPELLSRPRGLGETFDRIPDDYARPPYPSRVFDLLTDCGALVPGAAVLEIGPGTGQATIPMLDRGAEITAVEPGAALSDRLRARTAGRALRVLESTFEGADVPAAAFDLVASATAFHWVDPTIGPAKCAEVLRDRGWLALWWTVWGDPDRPDPFRDALRPFLAAKAPELLADHHGYSAYLRDLAARAERITATGAFAPLRREVMRWEGDHDPVGLRRLFGTFAGWLALPEPRRVELLDDVERIARTEFDGRVRRPYQTVLYLGRREPRREHPTAGQ